MGVQSWTMSGITRITFFVQSVKKLVDVKLNCLIEQAKYLFAGDLVDYKRQLITLMVKNCLV